MNQDTQPIGDDINIYGEVKYILTLVDASIQSTSWLLNDGLHRIGRINDYEILLDDITVSRNHGIVTVNEDLVEIKDEESTNGIFVNGELIKDTKLKPGDRIQIGKYLLLLVKV